MNAISTEAFFVQSTSDACALGRTLTATLNGTILVGQGMTSSDPNLFFGKLEHYYGYFSGPGTYVINLLASKAGSQTCAAAHVTYTIENNGQSTLVENVY